jgi:hypothetical protein
MILSLEFSKNNFEKVAFNHVFLFFNTEASTQDLELLCQPLFVKVFLEIGFHKPFALAGFKLILLISAS